MSKDAFNELKWQIAQKALSCLAPSNGFSKYSGEVMVTNATALYARPCAFRAFQDIRVLKLLGYERNIKKISFAYTRQLRELFVQSAYWNLWKHLLTPES